MLFTLSLILLRPSFSVMIPLFPLTATMAPGCLESSYALASARGNMSIEGIGKKEPYRALARSPSSVAIGWWTVTRYVPVGNVPSTISSVSEETTEGSTWRRPSMVLPIDMRSATVWLPSRMSCTMGSAWERGQAGSIAGSLYFVEIVRN